MSVESKATVNHDEIKRWAEERNGVPATVKGTEHGGEEAGLLRIKLPQGEDEALEEIGWEDFFKKFEEKNLAFLYQETTTEGERSYFSKFVDRSSVEAYA
ncbi:MAG: hypothetical protein GF401_08975 [Chitinivibrionales bacterium]|nr:hypothetical protein [Chitinivibrionales bacterium]